jgi:hypothetical protein
MVRNAISFRIRMFDGKTHKGSFLFSKFFFADLFVGFERVDLTDQSMRHDERRQLAAEAAAGVESGGERKALQATRGVVAKQHVVRALIERRPRQQLRIVGVGGALLRCAAVGPHAAHVEQVVRLDLLERQRRVLVARVLVLVLGRRRRPAHAGMHRHHAVLGKVQLVRQRVEVAHVFVVETVDRRSKIARISLFHQQTRRIEIANIRHT